MVIVWQVENELAFKQMKDGGRMTNGLLSWYIVGGRWSFVNSKDRSFKPSGRCSP